MSITLFLNILIVKNYVRGIVFAIGSLVLIGIQPIIMLKRPPEIDAYLFASMTIIYQALIFFPLFMIERKKFKLSLINKSPTNNITIVQLNGWKKNKKLLIYIAINFAFAQILFYLAYQFAGAINASLAQKTSVIFGLVFGVIINHEKISISQIIFSILLLFGLTIAVTQGSFNLLEFNIGVLLMIITTALWMSGHAITKPFIGNEFTPIQLVFIRNSLNGIILISTYFIFFPLENFSLLINPINHFYFIVFAFVYGFDLYCWYKSLSYIEVSTASSIISPSPIITAFLASIFLGEIFTIYHLIGTIIIFLSIIIIVKKKSEKRSLSTVNY